LLQPFTESFRQIESFAISDQADNVPSAIQNSGAVGACLQVRGHAFTQARIDLTIDVVGDLSPHVNATDLNNRH
jgi:hypothetical protein